MSGSFKLAKSVERTYASGFKSTICKMGTTRKQSLLLCKPLEVLQQQKEHKQTKIILLEGQPLLGLFKEIISLYSVSCN